MKLENGMFVICPKNVNKKYLTAGKKYQVYDVLKSDFGAYTFYIKNDFGSESFCLLNKVYGCSHLDGGIWIIDNNKNN